MIGDDLFRRRAAGLEWLIFDVDGVLTDGRLHYSSTGEELKTFHVRDGLAFRLAQRAGVKLALLSGRSSTPLQRRAEELDLDAVLMGSRDKCADLDALLAEHATSDERLAFVGDDLQDLPVLRRAALSFAPADAAPEVLAAVDRVLATRGGGGVAREMIELVLKARGDWPRLVAPYLGEA